MGANQPEIVMSNYHFCYSPDAIKHCIDILCSQYLCLVTFLPENVTLYSCDANCVLHHIDACCHTDDIYEILLTIEEEKGVSYGIINLIWGEGHFIEVDKEYGIDKFGSDYKSLCDYEIVKKTLEFCCNTTVIHNCSNLVN